MLRFYLLAGTAAALLPQGTFAQATVPAQVPAANSDGGAGTGSADAVAQPNAARGLPADASGASQPTLTVRPPPNPDDAIVVTGRRRRTDDILGDVAVLSGASLAQNVRPTIGETLSSQPGVTASGSARTTPSSRVQRAPSSSPAAGAVGSSRSFRVPKTRNSPAPGMPA